MKRLLFIFVIAFVIVSCKNVARNEVTVHDSSSSITSATGFSIHSGKGYTQVDIKDPWKDGQTLQSYILVLRDSMLPNNLPKGAIIRTPLQKALVYSSVHGGVIKELGGLASIKGVCDASYFNMAEIQDGISKNKIIDAGSSMSPSIEKIIELSPDVIILSPFQNAGYGALINLGVPIIECADYMESTPLGRAEWIKFFGLLYDKQSVADSIFNSAKKGYNTLASLATSQPKKPKVITENVISGVWYVPGGKSYMANIITDAGGDYPWKDDKSVGSLSLDFTQVFNKAHDADIWLIKTFDPNFSYSKLKKDFELNERFDVFKNRGIYYCNTSATTLYQDFPFHPDVLLKEYISIFHPKILNNYNPKYFKPLPNE